MFGTGKSGIYLIRCTATKRVYVGSAVDLKRRWTDHRRDLRNGVHHSAKLQRAWNRFGADAFSFEPVLSCDVGLLKDCEQELLNFYGGARHCFNISDSTIAPMLGRKMTAEAKRKRAIALAPVYASREFREKMAEASRLSRTPHVRAAIGAASSARNANAEYRQNASEKMKTRYADPAERKRTGELSKAAITPEGRAKQRKAISAFKNTPEEKHRVAEQARMLWSDPDHRARRIEALKKAIDAEAKKKRSELLAAQWADPVWRAAMLARRAEARASRI